MASPEPTPSRPSRSPDSRKRLAPPRDSPQAASPPRDSSPARSLSPRSPSAHLDAPYPARSLSPRSPRGRSPSPVRESPSHRSPTRDSRSMSAPRESPSCNRSPSPRRSVSPRDRSPTPRRSLSPRHGSPSPIRDRSPLRRDDRSLSAPRESPSRNRSPSPRRSLSPRDRSPTPRRSLSPRRGSPLPIRDRSPFRRDDRPPPRRRSPVRHQAADKYRPGKRARSPPPPVPQKTEEEKLEAAKIEYNKMLNQRSGGAYIPPHKLRALQGQITDKESSEYQRMAWMALKKSINGLVNKVNVSNIKHIVPELFGENLVRGRGLFCQSLLKAQASSLPFTPVYACLVAITNTKLPQVGELLVKRLIIRFRKAFKRSDKAVLIASTVFLAQLVNYQVVSELLAAQMLLLLLQTPTDDSVEVAVELTKQVGGFLEEMSPAIANTVFDQFRAVLHEGNVERRVQYAIEVLFQVRKDKYKDYPAIKEELDLVEEDDQICHVGIRLDDPDIDVQDGLNVFKMDPDYEANEEAYRKLKSEILGEGSDDEDDEDEDESSSDSEDEEQKILEIKDQTNADLVNLRRTIYLTIQSSADPQEAAHKLMKLRLPAGQEPELVSMIIETAAQEKTYLKFHGLLAEVFAKLNRMWTELYETALVKYYSQIHRFETAKLRNIARLFGHLLASDAIGWHVLSTIRLTEEDTTSASRIFIKILFEDLQENMGIAKLKTRLGEETLKPSLEGLFPHDNPKNIRFSINYFTSIKMGYLTEEMREFLAKMPKPALPAPPKAESDSASSYSSYTGSSYSSRSRSRSRSRSPRRADDRGRSISRSPPPRRIRDRSDSSRGRSPSRTPPRKTRYRSDSRGRSYTRSVSSRRSITRSISRRGSPRRAASRSATPPRRSNARRSYTRSPSRSPSPLPYRRGRSPSRTPSRSRSRSRTRSRSYSRSPVRARPRSITRSPRPPTRARPRSITRSPLPKEAIGRRRRADSYSVSPSPPPPKRRRNSSSSRGGRSPSPPPRRRSRSPPPKRGRAAY